MRTGYYRILVHIILLSSFCATYANDGSAMFDGHTIFFEGGTDYYVPVNPEANFEAFTITGTAITLESWIYLADLPSEGTKQVIMSRNYPDYDLGTVLSLYELRISNIAPNTFPRIEFYLSGTLDTEGIVGSTLTPELGEWIHVAGTYDGTSMKLYINGQLENSQPFTAIINPGGAFTLFTLGGILGTTSPGENYYFGCIDDARLWNVTRSPSQIMDNMNDELSGNEEEEGLVGNWTLGIEDMHSAVDSTINHNDLREVHINFGTGGISNSGIGGVSSYFINYDHNNTGTSAVLQLDQNIDAGQGEVGIIKEARLYITNNGDQPCFGKFGFSTGNDIQDVTPDTRYIIGPQSTPYVWIDIIPQTLGLLQESIVFNEGNAYNLPQNITFQIESVNLDGFDANNIGMWMNNNGQFAHNPLNNTNGLYWPLDEKKNLVYASGLWVGAKVNGERRTSICYHNSDFRPGPVGIGIDPGDQKYRLYKINKGDNSSNPDYAQWPDELGAPVNADGTPKIIGDQTLFMVYNDSDPNAHIPNFGQIPLGVEIQQTVFGFTNAGSLSNSVFLRFKILNKSNDIWDSTYCSLWSDPDLGAYDDDLVGIDTILTMGYCYNGSPVDEVFDSSIPAIGYDILQGAFYTKPIQAFAYYTSGDSYPYNDPQTVDEAYNFMSGKLADGSHYKDRVTGENTLFPLSGNPVDQSGSYDDTPGDRRFLFSTGPFTLEPNQAKEIIAAIIVARGDDYLDSVTKLKTASNEIQAIFDEGNIFGGAVENVTTEEFGPTEHKTINDISNSGTELDLTSDENGAFVELASFIEPPTGTEDMEGSAVHGVGSFLNIQTEGSIQYPVQITIYYTQNDLDQAGIVEEDLEGIYYWSASQNEWILYSNSGTDDLERGTSTTGVSTDNLQIEDNNYEGKVWAEAYHLTPIRIGTKIDSNFVGIRSEHKNGVNSFNLKQNYPNPFNNFTTVEYSIPEQSLVQITIYNIAGKKIADVYNAVQNAGPHSLRWDAQDKSSGVYFVKIHCSSLLSHRSFDDVKKIVLLK